jgi:hypothetical protein
MKLFLQILIIFPALPVDYEYKQLPKKQNKKSLLKWQDEMKLLSLNRLMQYEWYNL